MKRFFLAIAAALPLSLPLWAQQTPTAVETRFLEYTELMAKEGDGWAEDGYSRQANWFYGQAASAIAGWRTAIAQIGNDVLESQEKKETAEIVGEAMEHKDEYSEMLSDVLGSKVDYGALLDGLMGIASQGEAITAKVEETNEKLADKAGIHPFELKEEMWHSVRSLCMASPYSDFFRGLVCDWRGDEKGSRKYYGRAAKNPNFPGFEFDFSYLAKLSFQDLVALSNRLKTYQVKYESRMTYDPFHFEEDVPGWDAAALARTAADLLSGKCQDVTDGGQPVNAIALRYFEAARHADPFDVTWTYLCAMYYAYVGNGTMAAQCLNEALKMDAGNPRLRAAVAEWNAKCEER